MAAFIDAVGAIADWGTLPEGGRLASCETLLDHFCSGSWSVADVAELAQALASSGDCYLWPDDLGPLADVPSTGGPSSLATLLCPYLLAASGIRVPKLGVPGSTAGALDTLELLEGFDSLLPQSRAEDCLRHTGVVHLLADDRLAPADRYLFEYRKRVGKKAVPPLVAASLLAKKLASGCRNTALDVRSGPSGNIGDLKACREFSGVFCAAASELGFKASCVISSVDPPATPYFGRSESLVALFEILWGEPRPRQWVADHVADCLNLAAEAIAMATNRDPVSALVDCEQVLSTGMARASFEANLSCQGASANAVTDLVEAFSTSTTECVSSQWDGKVSYISRRISQVIGEVNRGRGKDADRAGVTCLAMPNTHVAQSQPVFAVRFRSGCTDNLIDDVLSQLGAAIESREYVGDRHKTEVVRNWTDR